MLLFILLLLYVQQILHRDLAARNILLGEGRTCKITDFGLALLRDKNQYLYCTTIRKVNIYEIEKLVIPSGNRQLGEMLCSCFAFCLKSRVRFLT